MRFPGSNSPEGLRAAKSPWDLIVRYWGLLGRGSSDDKTDGVRVVMINRRSQNTFPDPPSRHP